MTESLKNMLRGAKTLDEAYDVLCLHRNELSAEDQMNMFKMVTGKSELSEDELDIISGGNIISIAFGAMDKAADSAVNWCNNHKREFVFAACVIAGIAIGAVSCGVGTATGLIAVSQFTNVSLATTVAVSSAAGGAFGGLCGSFAGYIGAAFVGD